MKKERKSIEDFLSRISNRMSEYYPDDKVIQTEIRQALMDVKRLKRREKDAIKYETELIPCMAEQLRKMGFNPMPKETNLDIIEYFCRGQE